MSRRKPEVVFHLAAQADVRVSVADPVLDADINILGSLRALEGAGRSAPARWSLRRAAGRSTGTSSSYRSRSPSPRGRFRRTAWPRRRSGTTCTPIGSCTGWSTRPWPSPTSTAHARTCAERRVSSPSSPAACFRGEPCLIFGDGKQTRDFVFVDDVVDAFSRAGERGSGLLCNIGTGIETSVNDLYAAMARNAGVKPAADLRARPSGGAATQLPGPEQGDACTSAGSPGRPIDKGTAAVLDWSRETRRLAGGTPRLGPGHSRPSLVAVSCDRYRNRSSSCGRTTSARTDDSRNQDRSAPRTITTGYPARLPLRQLGGGRHLVDDAHLGHGQLPAGRVHGAPEVDHGRDAGAPDGHIGQAGAPRPAEGVGDDDPGLEPGAGPGGRRGCGVRCGPGRRGAGRPGRRPRWTGRPRRWRRQSRGGSRR